MPLYIFKRILLIFPTLFFIILINFLVIQAAPGGPVEQFLSKLSNTKLQGEVGSGADIAHSTNFPPANQGSKYYLAKNIDPEIMAKIEKLYGFDVPLWQRFWRMLKKFLTFDFGVSFYQDKKVVDLVLEKMPVSISLGLWSTLLIYLISIPLGIKKAVKDGTKFDSWSSAIVIIAHAIPSFLLAILLIILFAGGNFLNIFPSQGLVSSDFSDLNWYQKFFDYLWHMILPIFSMVIGGFAGLTFFCKNSFLEEINKQYVLTAKAKGLTQKQVLYKHVFRNALLIVIAGFPSALIGILFTGSMLTEIIFSLDGFGLLGYEAAISRDYPVMFGTLYCFTFIALIMAIIGDVTYKIVDPRINFDKENF